MEFSVQEVPRICLSRIRHNKYNNKNQIDFYIQTYYNVLRYEE